MAPRFLGGAPRPIFGRRPPADVCYLMLLGRCMMNSCKTCISLLSQHRATLPVSLSNSALVAKAGEPKTPLDKIEVAVIPLAGPPIPVLSIPNQSNRHVDSLQALPPNQTANTPLRRAHESEVPGERGRARRCEEGAEPKRTQERRAEEGRGRRATRSEGHPGMHSLIVPEPKDDKMT